MTGRRTEPCPVPGRRRHHAWQALAWLVTLAGMVVIDVRLLRTDAPGFLHAVALLVTIVAFCQLLATGLRLLGAILDRRDAQRARIRRDGG